MHLPPTKSADPLLGGSDSRGSLLSVEGSGVRIEGRREHKPGWLLKCGKHHLVYMKGKQDALW